MSSNERAGNWAARWVRWIARLVGALVAAFWLFSGIVSVVVGPQEPWSIESTMMVIFILTLTVGVIVAWWRAGIGGTVLTVCGVAFGIFGYVSAGHNKGFAVRASLEGTLLPFDARAEWTEEAWEILVKAMDQAIKGEVAAEGAMTWAQYEAADLVPE